MFLALLFALADTLVRPLGGLPPGVTDGYAAIVKQIRALIDQRARQLLVSLEAELSKARAAEVEVVAPSETAVAQLEVAVAEELPETPAPVAAAVEAPPAKPAARRKRASDNQISLLPE